MNRRSIGRTLVVALIGIALVALPAAGLAAVDGSPADDAEQSPLTTEEMDGDGMNDSDGMDDGDGMDEGNDMETTEEMDDNMETTEEMNDDMETTEEMDDSDGMDDEEDESEGGSLDGFGVVAAVLAAVAMLGYSRLR